MTNVLTLTPGTFRQSSFDKVGDGRKYEEIELKTTGTKATFAAKTPIQLHPGTTISGDEKAIIQLIPYASTCLWKPQVPVFSFSGNYLFEGFTFDGLADKRNVLHGKGYHNLFGGNRASKVIIRNVKIQNSNGDAGLTIKGNNITNCGQMPVIANKETADRLSAVAGICLDGWTEVDIQENVLDGNCNGILIGTYITTSARSGYVVRLTGNEIKNTVDPFNRDAYAGYAIAVTVPCKFNVISEENTFRGNLKDVFGI